MVTFPSSGGETCERSSKCDRWGEPIISPSNVLKASRYHVLLLIVSSPKSTAKLPWIKIDRVAPHQDDFDQIWAVAEGPGPPPASGSYSWQRLALCWSQSWGFPIERAAAFKGLPCNAGYGVRNFHFAQWAATFKGWSPCHGLRDFECWELQSLKARSPIHVTELGICLFVSGKCKG